MRLIDSEKLIKKNCEDMHFNNDFMSCAVLSAFNKMLMNEPEIREINISEPAKHGKWLFGGDDVIECSVCKEAYFTRSLLPRNYCPNCGAKMNGGDENAVD